MQEYIGHSTNAALAFHRGNYRESANNYLKAFQASPWKHAENRWHIFHGYTSILQEEYFKASKSDFEALQRIVLNKKELGLYRCEAAFTVGLLSWIHNERDEAAAYYRDAIRIAGETPQKERKKKQMATLVTPDGNGMAGMGERPVGDLIDEILGRAQDNLSVLQGNSMSTGPSNRLRSDGTPLPPAFRQTNIAVGPEPTSLTKEQIDHMLSVGGDSCDCCKKTRQELGIKHLKQCARCKRAYYCSPECQKQQWKTGGHGKHCRKPGEIKPDDYVRLTGIQRNPELNGQLVKVIAAVSGTPGRWEVRIPGGNRSVSIATEKMENLRPLK